MNLLSQMLQHWISRVVARPRLFLAAAFVIALSSIFLTVAKLEMETDQLELISKNHPLIELSNRLDNFRMGGKNTFSVVVEAPSPDQAVGYIKQLAAKVREDKEHFQDIVVRVDPENYKNWQLLYLDKEDLLRITQKLDQYEELIQEFANNPDLIGFLKLANREMASRMVGELFTGFLDDSGPAGNVGTKEPFDLSFLITIFQGMLNYLHGSPTFTSPWSAFLASSAFNPQLEGYFWEADKHYLIAFLIARKTENGFLGSRSALITLREYMADLKTVFPGIQAGVTGQEALRYDEVGTVSKDMTKATWLSLLGVLVLLVIFFRSFRRSLLQIITLMVGLCWAFGWITLFIGHLNILSVVFAPLLCGLGVDYGIHWMTRYEEEDGYTKGDPRATITRVAERSGPAVCLAGISGALCFLPLFFTGFRGLMELGLVTGMGILCILVATFSVLPALNALGEGKSGKTSSPDLLSERRLFRFTPFQSGIVLSCALLLCAAAIWSAAGVYFDPNPLRLQSANAESVIWEKKLIESLQHTPLHANAFCDSPEEVRAKSAAFERMGSCRLVQSVFSLLPEDQEEKLPMVHSLGRRVPVLKSTELRQDPQQVEELIDVIKRISFKMQEDQMEKWGAERPLVEQVIRLKALANSLIEILSGSPDTGSLLDYRKHFVKDAMGKWDVLRSGANATAMGVPDLPERLRDLFLWDGTYLLRIYPRGSIFKEHVLDSFVREIRSVDPNVIGTPVAFYVFSTAMKNACIQASVYSVTTIFVLLMLSFRSVGMSLLVLIPLLLGTLWTVGVMGLAGVEFNLANSMFMPLVVGAGVEYGIIILQRWKERNAPPGDLPFSTGKGVIVAALSTTIGFGTLMVSEHRGIFSLGFVAWEGSLCVLVSAIIVLPAILALMKENAQEIGTDGVR